MAERKIFTKTITRKLDDAGIATVSRKHCDLLNEVEAKRAEQKEVAKEFKEAIDRLVVQEELYRKAIGTGELEEHVECYEETDKNHFEVHVRRADNNELIDTRAMTAEERRVAMQMELPITGDGGGAPVPDAPEPQAKIFVLGGRAEDPGPAHNHGDDVETPVEGCTACWIDSAGNRVEPEGELVDDDEEQNVVEPAEDPGETEPEPVDYPEDSEAS